MPFEIDHKANEIKSIGVAANIDVKIIPKGTGEIVIGSDLDLNGKKFTEAGATVLQFSASSFNVNNIVIASADIGSPPRIDAVGDDTNINLELRPKGTGSVDVFSSKIINVDDPTSAQDAATKQYVDDNAGMSNPMTTADDIIVGGASGAPTRLGGGTDDEVLTMVSGVPAWAAAGGGETYFTSTYTGAAPTATGTDTLVIGEGALGNNSQNSVIIGRNAKQTAAGQFNNTIVGTLCSTDGFNTVAVGYNTTVTTDDAVAFGMNCTNTAGAVSMGINCAAGASGSSVAVGHFCNVGASATNGIALGKASVTVADQVRVGNSKNSINFDGAGALTIVGSGANAQYVLPIYTVATLPTGVEGGIIYVSDGDAGAKCLAVYDGTNYKVVALGATVASS